jgi:hypothetical protein
MQDLINLIQAAQVIDGRAPMHMDGPANTRYRVDLTRAEILALRTALESLTAPAHDAACMCVSCLGRAQRRAS